MKSFRIVFLAAVLVLGYALAAAAAPNCTKKIESFDFVVDTSGSMMMKDPDLKMVKMDIAREVLANINAKIPALDYNGGLHVISPKGTLVPQGPWDRNVMAKGISQLKSNLPIFGRMTYMGDNMSGEGYQPFLSALKRDAAIILVTDGDNNRGVDFVSAIQAVYASQRDLVIHVISFADTPYGKANVEAIGKMHPGAIVVDGAELFKNEAALDKFVMDVWCAESVMEDVIVLRGVNFAFNSSELDQKAIGILNEAASIIKNTPSKRVLLTGWTDFIGSDAYNMKLSQRRANSVKQYLESQGIPGYRMTAIGRGKSFKYDNNTEEGRYMNRRTELSFD